MTALDFGFGGAMMALVSDFTEEIFAAIASSSAGLAR